MLIKVLPLALSIFVSIFVAIKIFLNQYSPLFIYWWLASIVFIVLYAISEIELKFKPPRISLKYLFIVFCILFPAFVRISYFEPYRAHSDELITAYFSATEKFSSINFFGGIPTDKTQWVSQFPTMFFVLQKMFFLVFGESYMSVKYSIIPYVIITSLMLYLITKQIFNTKTAVISLLIYAFFAPSLYLETLGLHFISSTTSFMIFFYIIILYFRQNNHFLAILTGISCGFCYLFYITSFIAFPFMLIMFLLQLVKIRKKNVLINLVLAIIGFLIVTGPYIGYISRNGNYFTSRMEQVSLLTGSWSGTKDKIKKGEKVTIIIKENLLLSIKSLYKNGIGGHGGYNFGHLAFFDRYSLYLFLLGLLVGFILFLRKIEVLFIIMVILTSFFIGVVFSIPPPAYHRFSLAFPFIAITFSLPFYLLFLLKKTNRLLRYLTIIILIMVFFYYNQKYFLQSAQEEKDNISLIVASYINRNYPNRNIYVASFPGFIFEKMYYFSPGKSVGNIHTDYHDNIIKTFNPNEKYVYVIFFPNDFNDKFAKLDPNGKIIDFKDFYSLFVN